MIKKMKFIISIFGLFVGFFIFGTSLIMASQFKLPNSPTLSERKFYTGEKILPDHIFYPLLMVADKIILETSTGNRKIGVKIRLADDRLNSSLMLADKEQEELAFSTMTKSQKYLITATHDFLVSDDQSELVRKKLLKSLQNHSKELKNCRNNFKNVDTNLFDSLLKESDVLIKQLEN